MPSPWKRVCKALHVHFDQNFAAEKFGGYSFQTYRALLGDYQLIRPCFDKTEYIAVFPSTIREDADYGCFRLDSRNPKGGTHSGDISILPRGMMEIGLLESGYNFLVILNVDIDDEEANPEGMMMTLGKDDSGRWVPMCLPVALVRPADDAASEPSIVGPNHNQYETFAAVLQKTLDSRFVKTISHIKKAAG